MTDFHFDALLTVHSPICVPPFGYNTPYLYCYDASVGTGGSQIPVCVAQRVPRENHTELLPGGVSAQVVGHAYVKDGAICVDATSAERSEARPGDIEEPTVLVAFSGVVVSPDLVPGVLSISLVDVRVIGDGGDGEPATILRCRFDRSKHHLKKLRHLSLHTGVVISGTLVAVVDGHMLVDVHDVKFDENEPPCVALSAIRASPALRRLGNEACHWISFVLRGGKHGAHGNAFMAAAEASDSDESAWLEHVNGTVPVCRHLEICKTTYPLPIHQFRFCVVLRRVGLDEMGSGKRLKDGTALGWADQSVQELSTDLPSLRKMKARRALCER
ncbi:hypothetical protein AURDEDRAFT_130048 [Auricularia subglabra TFB-10046 SS5]|uniref:Uncharacterized protein n=1 Tax=Auricularia subglabra (strain TFB-10046 / SS5) TaxID=717982 RepID=J0CYP5_AURST|nr:hypothetical protein AURDEDRAFT_130048 [Auricularia subglabra TFB-10046 SS5]